MLKKGEEVAGKYVIKESLGKGGSSEVFLVKDMQKNCLYTLKASSDKVLLKQEAMLTGEINSRYFPAFIDFEEGENMAYLVLEYIEGTTLQSLLDSGRCFSEQESLFIMEYITAALSVLHLHRMPLVHLDIKPANIMISPQGEVRIIDMGAGSIVGRGKGRKGGTYGYSAPEQLKTGAIPGPEADVYACGKLLLYLLTGKNPAHPPYEAEKRMVYGKRGHLCRIIKKCLEPEAGRRYPNAAVLHREIRRLQEGKKKGIWRKEKKKPDVIYVKCLWKSDYERV